MKPRKPLPRSKTPIRRTALKRGLGKKGKARSLAMAVTRANYFALGHGRCQLCGGYFAYDDIIDVHHKVKRSLGGTDAMTNLVVLHRVCHFNAHSNADIFKRVKESCADAINGGIIE